MTVARRLAVNNPGGGGSPPPPSGSVLNQKPKIVGAYWPQWETVYPDLIPDGINTLLVSFAIPAASPPGAMRWDGMYGGLNQATFEDRIQLTREAGRSVLLSLGGESITYLLNSDTKVTNLVNSVADIYTTWGGFDGIDWDIEGGHITSANRQYHEAASRELKDFYGANFAIAMSYQGPDVQYKTMAQNLEATGDLDWASIQYYDYPNPQTSDVVSRLSEMVNTYGVSPAHLGIGVKFESGNSSTWTHANAISMWNTVEATYPTLRGMVTWETIQDRTNSNDFADTVAPVITS